VNRVDTLFRWAEEHGVDRGDLDRIGAALANGGFTLPGLDVQPFYEPDDFGWAPNAADRTAQLAEELDQLRGQLVTHPESATLVSQGSWQAFFLWRGSRCRPDATRQAPAGVGVTGLAEGGGEAGNSYFSVLGPGTEIKRHVGQFNGRLRCHIGLSVSPKAWIEVDGERRRWGPGECLIFSDALPHHVVNEAPVHRDVFAFDFWHPGVTAVERAALSMLLTSY
jgi:aspartyl/asparaginyl beta-hydroxylase (cupin superfamily)